MWTSPPILLAEALLGRRHTPHQRYGALLLYPLLLWCAWRSSTWLPAWAWALFCALGALGGWHCNYRRYRAVADTPTSRIRSAALGYTEVYGQAQGLAGAPLFSPVSGRPCLWYRWQQHDHTHRWRREPPESDTSDASFVLRDASGGEVLVQPEGAAILGAHSLDTVKDGWHIHEEWIAAGDPLYALGQLSASGGTPGAQALRDDIRLALDTLKQDRAELLALADRNRDGDIDLAEWDAVREQVSREIAREHAALATRPATLLLARPRDGRPFVISPHSPHATARYFRTLAWLHLGAGGLTALLLLSL